MEGQRQGSQVRPESLTLAFSVETKEEAEAAALRWAASEPAILEGSVLSSSSPRPYWWSVEVAIEWREEAPTLGLLA